MTKPLHRALESRADQCTRPFLCAFHALAVDDGGGWTGFPLRSFATLFIEHVVDSFQRAVICPQIEVVVDRASRRQVFRDTPDPLDRRKTARQAVHHLPHDHRALATASLAKREQRTNELPLVVPQTQKISQLAAVVTGAV